MATKKQSSEELVEEVKPTTKASDNSNLEMLNIIKSLQKEIETLKAERQNINLSVSNKDMEVKRVISPEMKAEMDRMNEKVLFQPMYDGVTYKEDIFVSINGKAYLINRREAYKKPIYIPRNVYDIIKESEKNLLELNTVKSGLTKSYENSIERLN